MIEQYLRQLMQGLKTPHKGLIRGTLSYQLLDLVVVLNLEICIRLSVWEDDMGHNAY